MKALTLKNVVITLMLVSSAFAQAQWLENAKGQVSILRVPGKATVIIDGEAAKLLYESWDGPKVEVEDRGHERHTFKDNKSGFCTRVDRLNQDEEQKIAETYYCNIKVDATIKH